MGLVRRAAYQLGASMVPIAALPIVSALVQQSLGVLSEGPTKDERDHDGHIIVLEIEDSYSTRIIDWRWETPNVYQFTAQLAVAVATQVARNRPTGWLTPAHGAGAPEQTLPDRRCRSFQGMSPRRKKQLMARFCLATWKLAAAVPGSGESAEPIAALGADTIAVEVVNEGDEFAVLFSVVDQVDRPENLECRIGFVNGTKACSVWRDRGFPLVDATIEWKGDLLQVTTPFFGADPGTMQYEGLFISIKGVHFEDGVDPKETLSIYYNQYQEAPDLVSPATIVCRRVVKWRPDRSKIVRSKLVSSALTLSVTSSRSPNLRPLETGAIDGVYMWSGTVDLSAVTAIVPPDAKTLRVNRADTFGVPAFRFENVEVLEFRLDLSNIPDIQRRLADLIEPLNFHLRESGDGNSMPDFRYRVATSTVLVELLRYGRMKLKSAESPLTIFWTINPSMNSWSASSLAGSMTTLHRRVMPRRTYRQSLSTIPGRRPSAATCRGLPNAWRIFAPNGMASVFRFAPTAAFTVVAMKCL